MCLKMRSPAQQAMRKVQGDPKTAHPFFWTPFLLGAVPAGGRASVRGTGENAKARKGEGAKGSGHETADARR